MLYITEHVLLRMHLVKGPIPLLGKGPMCLLSSYDSTWGKITCIRKWAKILNNDNDLPPASSFWLESDEKQSILL